MPKNNTLLRSSVQNSAVESVLTTNKAYIGLSDTATEVFKTSVAVSFYMILPFSCCCIHWALVVIGNCDYLIYF